jgi:GNAT superfamily N-acetyltransferase
MTRASVDVAVRPYQEEDEVAVLELLRTCLGEGPAGERSPEFFRWKHAQNTFGPSFMLVAETEGRIVGLRALMRWRWRGPKGVVDAVHAVDTATHPDYQGLGIFRRLTLEALEHLRGEVDLVFNTPNEKSLPGYLKMGWREVGRISVRARVRRPIRFGRSVRRLSGGRRPVSRRPEVTADPAASILADEPAVDRLLSEIGRDDRLSTDKGAAFLRWRYAAPPRLDYRAVHIERDGLLRGIAFFRVRARGPLWECSIADVLVPAGDVGMARRLLRAAVTASRVDHATCHLPSGSPGQRAAVRSGFVRAPGGPMFVVNQLRADMVPDPLSLSSWALCLGDVEVF